MYKGKDGVKRSTSDYYASSTLERWMTHERRIGEFVQIDEVYSDKTPVSFVVDFEKYVDKAPSVDPSLLLVKQLETIVETYFHTNQTTMSIQGGLMRNTNSKLVFI